MKNSPKFLLVKAQAGAGSLLAQLDVSASAVGPPETWPEQLVTVVGLALRSRAPAAVVWGPGLATLYNDAYALQLGNKHPAAQGKSFRSIWAEIWPELQPVIDAAFAGEASYFEDVPYLVDVDGIPAQRWYTSSFSPVTDRDGTVVGIYITAADTTRRMRAEHRYAFQSELAEQLRSLIAPDDITVAASALLGKRLGVSAVVYAEVDESGESVAMKADWTDEPGQSLAGTVLRLDDFGPTVGETVRAGQNMMVIDVTLDPRCAAYAEAYAERGVRSFIGIPLMKDGRLRAILNVHDARPHHWTAHEIDLAQDMVDRTWAAVEAARSQAELRAERDQSRYIFDSMTEGFGLVDRNWTIVHMNAEGLRITQRAAHQVIGKNHWEVWPELVGTMIGDLYERVQRTQTPEIIEMPFIFPDSKAGWVDIRAYPSLGGGLAFFFRDITEAKEAHRKLQEADRRKDEFLAMLAHELRNPLAPIGAAAQLLQMVKLDEARVRHTSQIIGRQVTHMTGLVDDLLDVSRVTRGLVELDSAAVDIRNIVTDAVEQVTPLIQARQHQLALHLPPDTTMVRGDKKRLIQVIANLLNNAAKYTQEGGRIAVKVEVHPARVVIDVDDNGIGMEPELKARVFDLFAQAERSSDRSSGGLGLGLALVKSLVELHHGTVRCDSAGPGTGSTFSVCLPCVPHALPGNDEHGGGQAVQADSPSLRIMVVDDNVDAARMLAMLLEAAGHQVMVEHSSQAALQLARKEAPQVCVLDIGLPETDGNELARQLRDLPATAHALLIAVTGYGQEQDRQQSRAAGFDHHLVKPVDTRLLTALIAQAEPR